MRKLSEILQDVRQKYTEEWYKKRLDLKTEVNEYLISTVELAFEINNYKYETMVFKNGNWNDLYCRRYLKEKDAIKGHKEIVERMEKGEKIWNY